MSAEPLRPADEPAQQAADAPPQPAPPPPPPPPAAAASTTPGGQSSSSTSRPHAPYESQFSPATQALLTKMRTGAGNLSSALAGAQAAGVAGVTAAKYEDAKRRLMLSLKTSDTIQLPSAEEMRSKKSNNSVFKYYKNVTAEAAAVGSATASGGGGSGLLKRKRSNLVDDVESPYSDSDANNSPQPRHLLPPKPPVRKRKIRNEGGNSSNTTKRCSRCDRQASTEDNFFLTCPRCDEDWHLGCTPPTLLRTWRTDAARFRCFGCVEEARLAEEYGRAKSEVMRLRKEQEVARQRQRTLSGLPVGVTFEKTDMIGFGAGNPVSDSARSEYFSTMGRKDQLSLLSFCDKLRPGLLADLLASVSKKHPDLPVFNSPDWAAHVANRPPAPKPGLSIESGAPKPRTLLNGGSGSSLRGTPQGSPGVSTCLSKPEVSEPFKRSGGGGNEDPDVPVDDDDDLLPQNWPKEEEGLYPVLRHEGEDVPTLVDGEDGVVHAGYKVGEEREVKHLP